MPLFDTLREIDRLFHSAASAAASNKRTITAFTALATAATVHAQTSVYVDDGAPAGGNGASWPTAFRDLQDALAYVHLSHLERPVLRIAQGEYRPHDNGAWSTFRVTSGMTLMGGFAGLGHTNPDAHDPVAFATVLTGDVLGDDGSAFANRSDNLATVVTIDSVDSVGLFDLTIRGGTELWAAGVVCTGNSGVSNVTLVNCRLTDHTGTAIFAAEPVRLNLLDCHIEANRTIAGVSVIRAETLDMWRCTIRGNPHLDPWEYDPSVIRVGRSLSIDQSVIAGAPSVGSPPSPDGPLFGGAGSVTIRGSTIVTADAVQTVFAGDLNVLLAGSIVTSLSGQPARLSFGPLSTFAATRSCLHLDNPDVSAQAHTAVLGPAVLFASPRLAAPRGPDGAAETYLDNDLRLAPSSPAIDLSDTGWLPNDYADFDGDLNANEPIPFDLSGAPRIHDDPGTPNLGIGSGGALDAGPYEFQGVSCRADFDASGLVSVGDIFAFLTSYFAHSPDADFNRSGATDLGDIFDFLAAYFAGCP